MPGKTRKPPDDNGRRAMGRRREDALFPAPGPHAGLPGDYGRLLNEIRGRIQTERLRAVLAANAAMVLLYWDVGRLILERQEREGWGARVVDRLSADLRQSFPDMHGLSPRNLKYMRAFAAAWPDRAIMQHLAAQLPWTHNCILLDRLSTPEEREWYIRRTLAHGWSRNILAIQIESRAHDRQGKAISNFHETLRVASFSGRSPHFAPTLEHQRRT